MSNSICELEEHIMNCWNVTGDINALYVAVCDADLDADKVANILLGMQQLYGIKFDNMFRCFEEVCKEYHATRKEKEQEL